MIKKATQETSAGAEGGRGGGGGGGKGGGGGGKGGPWKTNLVRSDSASSGSSILQRVGKGFESVKESVAKLAARNNS